MKKVLKRFIAFAAIGALVSVLSGCTVLEEIGASVNSELTADSAPQVIVSEADLPFAVVPDPLSSFNFTFAEPACQGLGQQVKATVQSAEKWAYAGFMNPEGEGLKVVEQVIFALPTADEADNLDFALQYIGSEASCDSFEVFEDGRSYGVSFGDPEALDGAYKTTARGHRVHISHVYVGDNGLEGLQFDWIVATRGAIVTVILFGYSGIPTTDFDPVIENLLVRFAGDAH